MFNISAYILASSCIVLGNALKLHLYRERLWILGTPRFGDFLSLILAGLVRPQNKTSTQFLSSPELGVSVRRVGVSHIQIFALFCVMCQIATFSRSGGTIHG